MSHERFSFEGFPDLPNSAKLLHITQSIYESDWHSTVHNHPFCELFYVTSGSGIFVLEDSSVCVQPGDMIAINPHISHTEKCQGQSPLGYIALGVDGIMFHFSGNKHVISADTGGMAYGICRYRGDSDENSDILFYLRGMLEEVSVGKVHSKEICQNLLQIIILKMMRYSSVHVSAIPSKRTNKECVAIMRYIDMHFKEDITLDKIAEISHMNKYYLDHAFREYVGQTPIKYLISRRIKESRVMLESTDYSLSQIAGILGFSSQSYFSQVFKKLVGESPTVYRKKFFIGKFPPKV